MDFPERLYVHDDVCNTIRFTDSGVELDDFATLCDGPESVDGQANSTNEVGYITGLDATSAWPFAEEVARRWNAHPALLAALKAMLKTHDPCDTSDDMEEAREAARAAIAKAQGA